MIRVTGLQSAIGAFALNADFAIHDNEYFVLLGPSGSGKTMLLEHMCGLRLPVMGKIEIGALDVTSLSPRCRSIGYVPQDGALFDHLKVKDNIGFALSVAGDNRAQCDARINEVARLMGVSHLLLRHIKGLSGGERQRVALGRALARKPAVLLLDEPVSSLDEIGRAEILQNLKHVQKSLGISVLHVCHSLEEARLVSDRVGIMLDGTITQTGTLDEVRISPVSARAAQIAGCENVFLGPATVSSDTGRIIYEGLTFKCPQGTHARAFMIPSDKVRLVSPKENSSHENIVHGTVGAIERIGTMYRVILSLPIPVVCYVAAGSLDGCSVGGTVAMAFSPQDIKLLN
jgi:molybdate/tungstate transport system ATP-binding protein